MGNDVRLTAQLLALYTPEHIYNEWSKRQRFDIELALTKHLIEVTSYNQFSKELKRHMKVPLLKILRNKMLENFDLVVGLKYALLSVIRSPYASDLVISKVWKRYNVTDHSKLIEGLRDTGTYPAACKVAKSIVLPLEPLNKVAERCSNLMIEINDFISKFIWRKHKFIIKNYNVPAKDLISDLRVKAMRAFYAFIPWLSEEHTRNAVKRAVHNEGINRIKFYTAGRRKELTNDGNGRFSQTTINIDYDGGPEGDGGTGQNHEVTRCTSDNRFVNLELKLSIDSLMDKHGKQPRKRAVLKLLSLENSPSFVAFAQQTCTQAGIKKNQTTEDVFDVVGRDTFLELVRKHTRTDPAHFTAFINHIQGAI